MRITYNQASYIMHYTEPHRFQHYFCNWTVEPKEEGYYISCDMKWIVFILLYIPMLIVELINCLIFKGIINYIMPTRNIISYCSSKYDYVTKRIKEVLLAVITIKKITLVTSRSVQDTVLGMLLNQINLLVPSLQNRNNGI